MADPGPVSTGAALSCTPNQDPTATECVKIKTENLILIGSEMDYRIFWLKLMFIAASYLEASRNLSFRPSDKKTIMYVDVDYTRFEKLAIEYLTKFGYAIVKLSGSKDIVAHINNRPESTENGVKTTLLLQDVAFFSHGLPSVIKLNYNASPTIDFSEDELASTRPDAFIPKTGRLYSYACRTGIASSLFAPIHDQLGYRDDKQAEPDESLAQKMADHFQIDVHAFLRRSFYGNVLRNKSDSASIAESLREARKTQEGRLIEISDEHEALPHSSLGGFGAKREGTNDYALWRKEGGIELPTSAETPTGLSAGIHIFSPTPPPSPP